MKTLLASSALTKVIVIALITLFAGLPLARIAGLIDERGQSRQQAAHDAQSVEAGADDRAAADAHPGDQLVRSRMARCFWTQKNNSPSLV